ncbi:DUF5694 domain-containing protein [Algibacter aquimarinus]|uniref:TraB/GumN family protein n=1 Tax=Algibacter aquimarinus TaxID=1136748 RepID=A0ABP9H2T7_9FLAO
MRLSYLTLLLFISLSAFAQSKDKTKNKKPTIAILGTFHFAGSPTDAASLKVDDMKSEKRQDEILELVDLLAKFKPTKVIIERPFTSKRADSLYAQYLNGEHKLHISETQQLGFRLAKKLNHNHVYPADTKMDLPFDELMNYLNNEGKMHEFQNMMNSIMQVMGEMQNIYNSNSLNDFLIYMNSDKNDDLNKNLYLEYINKIGTSSNPIGSDVVAKWWNRNFKIIRNIDEITKPEDRVLVIFGQGHTSIFKDFYKTRKDYNYEDITKYLH